MFQLKPSFQVLALVATLGLAPAAHAEVPMARDTGVGQLIAAQGNQALVAIRAELRANLRHSIKGWRPAMPVRVEPVSLPVTAPAAGGGGGSTTVASSQACAK